ncbi:alpha/beta hydrolase [Inquilinus limosus]|uniref:alpha/beta hydrolase n=1 Tax=Inquilinus limosus TaxID=171674 RepID=UPI003F14AD13
MLNAIDRREFLMGLAAAGGAAVLAAGHARAAAAAAPAAPVAVPRARNVVLVHGAYADGSCWVEIIPRLQQAGLTVTAVQNPLQSLAEDCAFTQRILDLQDGPTVLVGHSYAGEVITQTGVHPKVSALVYCSARAPDADEDYTALAKTYPTPPASAGLVHAGGYAWLGEEAFLRDFAGDVDPAKARVLYAVQGRVSDTLFTAKVTQAAWRSKPSFYQVSAQDRTINPDLQRFMARRMNATTIELPSSHLGIVSHPQEITALILEAAGAA